MVKQAIQQARKQRLQWNPKVRQCVKLSPERQPDKGDEVDKVETWDCPYNRISSLGSVHTVEASDKTRYSD